MKECDILGVRVKTYSDPSYIFSWGSGPPHPEDLRSCLCG